MKFISRLLAFSFAPSVFFISWPVKAAENYDACKKSPLLIGIIKSIDDFSYSESSLLSCAEYERISSIPDESLFISTKRSRGKDQICLTESKETKCTFKIGYITGKGDPVYKLCSLMKNDCSTKDKPVLLTETVERLYLQPSTLIR